MRHASPDISRLSRWPGCSIRALEYAIEMRILPPMPMREIAKIAFDDRCCNLHPHTARRSIEALSSTVAAKKKCPAAAVKNPLIEGPVLRFIQNWTTHSEKRSGKLKKPSKNVSA